MVSPCVMVLSHHESVLTSVGRDMLVVGTFISGVDVNLSSAGAAAVPTAGSGTVGVVTEVGSTGAGIGQFPPGPSPGPGMSPGSGMIPVVDVGAVESVATSICARLTAKACSTVSVLPMDSGWMRAIKVICTVFTEDADTSTKDERSPLKGRVTTRDDAESPEATRDARESNREFSNHIAETVKTARRDFDSTQERMWTSDDGEIGL
jgi:hypothetical protein